MGKQAGTRIFYEIQRARKSIKIVSPYLSDNRLDELISLKRKNIDVKLITSDIERSNIEQSTLRKLFIQKREIDTEAKRKCEKGIKLLKILLMGFIVSILLETVLLVCNFDVKYLWGILPIIGIFICYKSLQILIKRKKIFNYKYSMCFPMKVYTTKELYTKRATFIHAKIYIIDDSVAYFGSLNFTNSGFEYNLETQVRTEDKDTVNKTMKLFNHLFDDPKVDEIDITEWGQKLYREPINDFF
ncbi:phospholipase D-like domain-containing protein [Bacteroides sp. CG01]|uniref:phospholipase D-like domain-containing protein n=1 Tax=Bacteroides sp. CG01 TaxID=3096000 RepID=UPI002AFF3A54|nr:phospholipase D-like domain-containing protein [Bacteroides sp. CG01]